MAKRAILALLVAALSTSLATATQPSGEIGEPDPVIVPPGARWMVWYEDETFEDCGGGLAPDQCTDDWQPALPHFVVTEAECRSIAYDYNRKAREEFECALERPAAKVDDAQGTP